MRFVISRILAAASAGTGPLAGLVDPTRIAVTGQSDGGDTALAAALDPGTLATAVVASAASIGALALAGLTVRFGSPGTAGAS